MKKNKSKRKGAHGAVVLLGLVFAAVFCFAGYKLGTELLGARREKAAFDELAALVAMNAAQSPLETSQAGALVASSEKSEGQKTAPDEAAQGEIVRAEARATNDVPEVSGVMEDAQNTGRQATARSVDNERGGMTDAAKEGQSESVDLVSPVTIIPPEAAQGEIMQAETGIADAIEGGQVESINRVASEPEAQLDAQVPLPEYVQLYEMNADFYGWLAIDGTNINYPVMYAPDRMEYYLKRAFDGSYSSSGVPFIDDACQPDRGFCIIHGHHMKDKTMFGQLPEYADETFFAEHAVIHFNTRFERRDYLVMAAFRSRIDKSGKADVFRYYEYASLDNPQIFNQYVAQVKAAALYDTGVDAEFGDELVVLSTCNYHTSDGRFVVVARRIRKDEGVENVSEP